MDGLRYGRCGVWQSAATSRAVPAWWQRQPGWRRAASSASSTRIRWPTSRHCPATCLPQLRRTAAARRGSPSPRRCRGLPGVRAPAWETRSVPSNFLGSSDFRRRTMTASSCLRSGMRAAGKSLVVQQFQQGRKALRVAVVRRGREEQLVLEVRHQQAQGLGAQRIGGVFAPTGRGAVVGLVQDQDVVAAGIDRLAFGRAESP